MSGVIKGLFGKNKTKSDHKDPVNVVIGQPTDFKHEVSVAFDKEKNDFIGLPDDWRQLLEKNNIL